MAVTINRSRSPNYPSISLNDAIDLIRKVYQAEKRAKFPRETLAAHIGYSSLNGRALSKIGAIRAYGLIDGKEDALSVSRTALAILEAPKDSGDYADALHEAFNSPALFQRILEEYDQTPSEQTLRWWLTQQGYAGDAADKALASFLASQSFVNSVEVNHIRPVMTQEDSTPAPPETASRQIIGDPRSKSPPTTSAQYSIEPDYKIQLGDDRWLLIEVKGGQPSRFDFIKLEMFAKFQRELLELTETELEAGKSDTHC